MYEYIYICVYVYNNKYKYIYIYTLAYHIICIWHPHSTSILHLTGKWAKRPLHGIWCHGLSENLRKRFLGRSPCYDNDDPWAQTCFFMLFVMFFDVMMLFVMFFLWCFFMFYDICSFNSQWFMMFFHDFFSALFAGWWLYDNINNMPIITWILIIDIPIMTMVTQWDIK